MDCQVSAGVEASFWKVPLGLALLPAPKAYTQPHDGRRVPDRAVGMGARADHVRAATSDLQRGQVPPPAHRQQALTAPPAT
jgi:hypothetical protein